MSVVFILTMLAGGVGSALRYLVNNTVRARFCTATRYPWATAAINVSGSLLLGVVVGLATSAQTAPAWSGVVGTGLIGGYTTFSTASVETTRLLLERRYRAALAHGVATTVVCVAAAAIGTALPQLL